MFDRVLKRLSILKNRMKNAENKAMLKSITVIMLNDRVAGSHKRNWQTFMNILTLTTYLETPLR